MQLCGYTYADIARKTGLDYDYVLSIARLLEKGEQRLLQAVEAGLIPINVAMVIADADDAALQGRCKTPMTRVSCANRSCWRHDSWQCASGEGERTSAAGLR